MFVFIAELSLLEAAYIWVLSLINSASLCLLNSIHLYLGWLLIDEALVLPFYLLFSGCYISIGSFNMCFSLIFWFGGFLWCFSQFLLFCVFSCLCFRFMFCDYILVCINISISQSFFCWWHLIFIYLYVFHSFSFLLFCFCCLKLSLFMLWICYQIEVGMVIFSAFFSFTLYTVIKCWKLYSDIESQFSNSVYLSPCSKFCVLLSFCFREKSSFQHFL